MSLSHVFIGSVLVSGSNPNADYTAGPDVKYPTEYRTERFFPSYYNQRRPQPKGLPSRLVYGGPSFDVVLDADDLSGVVDNVANATVVVIRPGFSTHSMVPSFRPVIIVLIFIDFPFRRTWANGCSSSNPLTLGTPTAQP